MAPPSLPPPLGRRDLPWGAGPLRRSLKVRPDGVRPARALIDLDRSAWQAGPEALRTVLGALALPDASWSRAEELAAGATDLLVGADAGAGHQRWKAYFERDEGQGGDGEVVHVALKWEEGSGQEATETTYRRRAAAGRDAQLAVIGAIAGEVAATALGPLVEAAWRATGSPPSQGLLEVRGEATGRRSVDVLVRRAGWTVADAEAAVRALVGIGDGLPPGAADALAAIGGAGLVRVATGLDEDGSPFVTLFHS